MPGEKEAPARGNTQGPLEERIRSLERAQRSLRVCLIIQAVTTIGLAWLTRRRVGLIIQNISLVNQRVDLITQGLDLVTQSLDRLVEIVEAVLEHLGAAA